jgi:sugar phosphate isomerase/epimerase
MPPSARTWGWRSIPATSSSPIAGSMPWTGVTGIACSWSGSVTRVFPGDGSHAESLLELIRRLRVIGFHGGFYLNACNDDFAQLPPELVADQARESLLWLIDQLRHIDLPRRRIPAAVRA